MQADLITLEEAADLMRQPVATLRFWRYNGSGPASAKLGRRVVYRRTDVEAWIDAQFEEGQGQRGSVAV